VCEDRQHAYVALTRGTDTNHAYVFTVSPKRADPVPGPRPAPELARHDQIHTERAGDPAPATPPAPPGPAFPPGTGHSKDAILKPPKPEIRPSARLLERAADRAADIEAAD